MTEPHPQRCETCKSFEVSPVIDSCPNEDYCGKSGCTITTSIWEWIKIHGCASHSSQPVPDGEKCCITCINVPCKILDRVPCPRQENPCEDNGCTDIENCDEICQHSRIYSPIQMQEGKKAAVKAERERLLGLIATYCACNGIEERIIGGDRFYEVEGTFSLPDFLNYIASLRGGEQK